ncbi:MAG: hypothetical protein C0445_00300 [Polaromonas sp.]|nr:hypothetical protein [Polaromonas sp.]
MAQVQIVACTVAPNITTTTYSSWCPAANRRILLVDDIQIQAGQAIVQVDRTHNQQAYDDMLVMFGLFILALVGIWGAKQLLNLFSSDTEK